MRTRLLRRRTPGGELTWPSPRWSCRSCPRRWRPARSSSGSRRKATAVQGGDIIAEIETDKADVEIEAFGSGVLRKILATPGGDGPGRRADRGHRGARRRHRRAWSSRRAPAAPAASGAGLRRPRPRPPTPAARRGRRRSARRAAPAARTPSPATRTDRADADGAGRRGAGDRAAPRRRREPGARRRRPAEGLAARAEDRRAVGRRSHAGARAAGPAAASSARRRGGRRAAPAARRRGRRRPCPRRPRPGGPEAEDIAADARSAPAIAKRMPLSKAPVPHFYITTEVAMDAAWSCARSSTRSRGSPRSRSTTWCSAPARWRS